MCKKNSILIVDDDPSLRKTLSDILRVKGYTPITIEKGRSALEKVKADMPRVVLIDLKLEDMSGIELIKEIKEHSLRTECIMLTGYATKESAIEAVNLGAYGYVQKPYDLEQLLVMIRRAFEKLDDEKALCESEERYRTIFQQAADSIVLIDAETGALVEFNDRAHENLGYTREEFKKLKIPDFEVIESVEEATRHVEKIFQEGADTFETKHSRNGGEIRDILVSSRVISLAGRDFIYSIWSDITERKRAEEQIQKDLKEKEVLLKEIHHRVKNNLQIICSLLNLQVKNVNNKQVHDILEESKNRIRSMAFIHEKLYQSDDFARINLTEYIQSLTAYLFHTYRIDSDRVELKTNIKEVSLSLDMAVPCGLLINELMTNALKYAFPVKADEPHGRKGKIQVNLSFTDKKYTLIVGDDGVGLPEKIDLNKPKTLGLQLINSLADQLDAAVEVAQDGGTTFKFEFQDLKYRKRL